MAKNYRIMLKCTSNSEEREICHAKSLRVLGRKEYVEMQSPSGFKS
jgi:hypothetical protein